MNSANSAGAAPRAKVSPTAELFEKLGGEQSKTLRYINETIDRAEGLLGAVLTPGAPPSDPHRDGPTAIEALPPTEALREVHYAVKREEEIQAWLLVLNQILDRVHL